MLSRTDHVGDSQALVESNIEETDDIYIYDIYVVYIYIHVYKLYIYIYIKSYAMLQYYSIISSS